MPLRSYALKLIYWILSNFLDKFYSLLPIVVIPSKLKVFSPKLYASNVALAPYFDKFYVASIFEIHYG